MHEIIFSEPSRYANAKLGANGWGDLRDAAGQSGRIFSITLPLEHQSIWPPAAVRADTARAAVLAETALRRGSAGSATPRSLPAARAAPGRTITNLVTASKLIGALA